jgi:hypothetical protein
MRMWVGCLVVLGCTGERVERLRQLRRSQLVRSPATIAQARRRRGSVVARSLVARVPPPSCWALFAAVAMCLVAPGPAAASGSCGLDFSSATACPVNSPDTLSGSIDNVDETDYYVFYARKGVSLSVTISDTENPACSSDTSHTQCGGVQAELYDSQGGDLGDGTGSSAPTNGATVPAAFSSKLAAAGTYLLQVTGTLGQDESGNATPVPYTLQVDASPSVQWPEPPHPGWTTQSFGALTGTFGQLDSVSCTAASACTASGFIAETTESETALLERWNGNSWTAEQVGPTGLNSEFTSVSCASASWCMAVGFDEPHSSPTATIPSGPTRPLAYSWNGSRWARSPQSAKLGALGCEAFPACAVACASPAACVEVGSGASGPAAASWNGTRWTVDRITVRHLNRGGSLLAVSCSAATACTAVGQGQSGAFAERWNGRRWTLEAMPRLRGGGFLEGVACVSSRDCFAVGADARGAVAERWNGHAWKYQRDGFGGSSFGLDSLSCPTATYCLATGGVSTDPENKDPTGALWNGATWKAIHPAPIGTDILGGASCVAAGICEEVGSITLPGGRTDFGGLLAQAEDDPPGPGVAVA